MQIPIYHVDAFTNKIFSGNPAAVCVLSHWLADHELTAIAKENNLPVTAFIVGQKEQFHIRWLTPEYELDLCGHGSLAAAYVIFNYLERDKQQINLVSHSDTLSVSCRDNLITLNFPAKQIEPVSLPILVDGLNIVPKAIYQHNQERCLAVYDNEEDILQLQPNMQLLQKLPHRGITVTAPGKHVDFVSRTFYPQKLLSEDAVTGASHCLLAPYWSKHLNKTDLHALQLSARGGEIFCQYRDNRVLISSSAVLFMQGVIEI